MENGNRQPSTSQNPPAPGPRPGRNYYVAMIPPSPFPFTAYIPVLTNDEIVEQGHQVMRFRLPENENQYPHGMLRPPMVNQLPVVHRPGCSWPFIPGPGIGQPFYYRVPLPCGHSTTRDVRCLNLDALIALVPGERLTGHAVTVKLINHYRQQWLNDYQGVMNQINQLRQSLVALKSRETCLFAPLNMMLEQQFNELPSNRRDSVASGVYQAFHDNLQNRIHNSGASDLTGLHAQCIMTSLNCMWKFLHPGNGLAPPPPGAGVIVPENPPGLHIHHRHH